MFNRKFLEDNVFSTDPAAIVIGAESKDAREKIARLENDIEEHRDTADKHRKDRESEQTRLDRLTSDLGREIRSVLLPAANVQGAHPRWSNFDKTDVGRIAEEIRQDVGFHLRDQGQLDSIIKGIAQHSYPQVQDVNVRLPATEQWIQRAARLCSISLVVSPLTEVADDERLSTWLDAGLKLIRQLSPLIREMCQ